MNEVTTEKKTPIFGILSTIFGAVSIIPIPMFGFLSLIGLPFGVIGLFRKETTLAIIGTVLSVVGVATSPVMWATVGCMLNSESCVQENTTQPGNTGLTSQGENNQPAPQ